MAEKKAVQQLEEDLHHTLTSLRNVAEGGFKRLLEALREIRNSEGRAELERCQKNYDAYRQHTRQWDDNYNKLSDPAWKRDLLDSEIQAQKKINDDINAPKSTDSQPDKKMGVTPVLKRK